MKNVLHFSTSSGDCIVLMACLTRMGQMPHVDPFFSCVVHKRHNGQSGDSMMTHHGLSTKYCGWSVSIHSQLDRHSYCEGLQQVTWLRTQWSHKNMCVQLLGVRSQSRVNGNTMEREQSLYLSQSQIPQTAGGNKILSDFFPMRSGLHCAL